MSERDVWVRLPRKWLEKSVSPRTGNSVYANAVTLDVFRAALARPEGEGPWVGYECDPMPEEDLSLGRSVREQRHVFATKRVLVIRLGESE